MGAGPQRGGDYQRTGTRGPEALLNLLHDRVADYRATVARSDVDRLPGEIARRLTSKGIGRLVVPPGLPSGWIEGLGEEGVKVIRDLDPGPLTNAEIDATQGVLTGCALAVAETGTLVLDGGLAQGRRVLSLLPDYHLCIVFQDQIVETVPEAVELLEAAVRSPSRPITLISGPSATSDIELIRVEGVHGPRTLEVILVEGSQGDS
jgi:L-lactate dehydrogenase complex protein LldG